MVIVSRLKNPDTEKGNDGASGMEHQQSMYLGEGYMDAVFFFFNKFIYLFIYLFLSALGLLLWAGFF